MGEVEQSPPPITMAFTSSYTYEWLQNHYSTFDEERRLLLADRNLEQRTAWEREVDAEYDSGKFIICAIKNTLFDYIPITR